MPPVRGELAVDPWPVATARVVGAIRAQVPEVSSTADGEGVGTLLDA